MSSEKTDTNSEASEKDAKEKDKTQTYSVIPPLEPNEEEISAWIEQLRKYRKAIPPEKILAPKRGISLAASIQNIENASDNDKQQESDKNTDEK